MVHGVDDVLFFRWLFVSVARWVGRVDGWMEVRYRGIDIGYLSRLLCYAYDLNGSLSDCRSSVES